MVPYPSLMAARGAGVVAANVAGLAIFTALPAIVVAWLGKARSAARHRNGGC